MIQHRHCPHCGYHIQSVADIKLCPFCGADISTVTVVTEFRGPNTRSAESLLEKQARRQEVIDFLIVFCIVLAIFYVMWRYM